MISIFAFFEYQIKNAYNYLHKQKTLNLDSYYRGTYDYLQNIKIASYALAQEAGQTTRGSTLIYHSKQARSRTHFHTTDTIRAFSQ